MTRPLQRDLEDLERKRAEHYSRDDRDTTFASVGKIKVTLKDIMTPTATRILSRLTLTKHRLSVSLRKPESYI